ncbi:MAG: flavodoxin family protein [Nitrospirota bacterium]|nr:flavodoxin family protein [Nitrospirota bacterium]
MPRYVCFAGSPRKGGNSDLLSDRVIAGAESKGMQGEKIYVYDTKLMPCTGCFGCDETGKCVLTDWSFLEEKVQGADGIIFSTAIYSRLMTGPMKCLMDRFRPFMKVTITNKGPIFMSRLKSKKHFIVITTNSAPHEAEAKPAIDIYSEFINKLTAGNGGMVGVLNGCGLKAKGQVGMDPAALSKLAEKMKLPQEAATHMLGTNAMYLETAYQLGVRMAEYCGA